jgi:hypothetical protein
MFPVAFLFLPPAGNFLPIAFFASGGILFVNSDKKYAKTAA